MRLIDADALIEKLDEMQIDTAYLLDNEDVGIARARDVVESFPTASQWISVDERLPELCEQRLLYEDLDGKTYEGRNSRPVIAHDRYVDFTYIARWSDVDGWIEEDGTMLHDVDHWMEIPE